MKMFVFTISYLMNFLLYILISYLVKVDLFCIKPSLFLFFIVSVENENENNKQNKRTIKKSKKNLIDEKLKQQPQ